MKPKIYLISLMMLAFGVLRAQAEPLHTQVTVNLPYQVRLGDKILEPSEYVFRQLSGTVLQIVKNPHDGANRQVEATVITLPTEQNKASEDTLVVLQRFGNNYYFDKIWVQGRGSGYEFPLPESVKSLERERSMTLSARLEPMGQEPLFNPYED